MRLRPLTSFVIFLKILKFHARYCVFFASANRVRVHVCCCRQTGRVPVRTGVHVAVFSGDCVCGRDSPSDGHHGNGRSLSLVCQQQRRHRPLLVRHSIQGTPLTPTSLISHFFLFS